MCAYAVLCSYKSILNCIRTFIQYACARVCITFHLSHVHRCLDPKEEIDLINVAFEQKRTPNSETIRFVTLNSREGDDGGPLSNEWLLDDRSQSNVHSNTNALAVIVLRRWGTAICVCSLHVSTTSLATTSFCNNLMCTAVIMGMHTCMYIDFCAVHLCKHQ